MWCCDHRQCMWSQNVSIKCDPKILISKIYVFLHFPKLWKFSKILEIFQIFKFVLLWISLTIYYMWSQNFVPFALYLTVSEKSANLCFFTFSKFLKCLKMLCCHHWQSMWSQNFVCFAPSLSLTVSEIIYANLFFKILFLLE